MLRRRRYKNLAESVDNNDLYLQNVKNYKKVFGSETGKKVLWDLLKACGFMSDGFDENPNVTSYNSGARSMVLRILKIVEMNESELGAIISSQRKAEQNERKHFNV